MKELVKKLKQLILNKELKEASSLLIQGLSQNEIKLLQEIKKQGVFRCSSYDFEIKTLQNLIDNTISKKILSKESISYFESVKRLLLIGRELKKVVKKLNQEIDKPTLKSYLACLDSLFWPHNITNNTLYESNHYLQKYGHSKEEIACAFSFLFFKIKNKKQYIEELESVDTRGINDNTFIVNLSNFYKIIDYREIEILLDYFDYKIIDKANTLIIKAADERLQKSIDLGYIRAEYQCNADSVNSIMNFDITDDNSLIQSSKKIAVNLKNIIFSIEEKPSKRIVMRFPVIKEIINSDKLFVEEKIQINSIQKEIFLEFNQILKIKFYNNICLFDIIKVQRLFSILLFAFFGYIEKKELLNSKLFWRSIIPAFEKLDFLNILQDLFGADKANDLLNLLSWNPDSNKVFDIQYYPILIINSSILLPLGIFCNSNLIRNVLQSSGYRFDSDGVNDCLGKLLEEALKPVSSFVKRNVQYSYKNMNGDIDVIAIIDEKLFIFECKNSLHPTNPFELRTSYDYIVKGAKQLKQIQQLLQDDNFYKYISERLNLSIPTQLCQCIVTGNRMFSGWQEQGINVRPIYELINIIKTGKIAIKEFNIDDKTLEGITFKLWKQESFFVNDLIDYMGQI